MTRHRVTLPGLLIALGIVVGACSGAASPAPATQPPGGASSSPDASAPCPTAPAASPDPAVWPAPGTAIAASVYPIIVSSEQVCGPNRFLFSFLDRSNLPVAAPDRSASVAFYDLGRDAATPVASADATFIWAIENERGVYVVNVDFPEAGEWGAEFVTAAAGAAPETIRVRFEVRPTGSSVAVGATAPASKTLTAADVGGDLAKLSTDPHPDPAFYELSVDQAIAQHRPFVLVFATPAFCASAQCGPTLDHVKEIAAKVSGVTFINVEPYRLQFVDGRLQPELDANGQLQPIQAVFDYGLVSEPWIFVVDRDGVVRASFEAIASEAELIAAVEAVR